MRVALLVVLASCLLAADDPPPDASVWYVSSIAGLSVEGGSPGMPAQPAHSWSWTSRSHPRIVLDGPGEAWVGPRAEAWPWEPATWWVAIRLHVARDIDGRLELPSHDADGRLGMEAYRFHVSADAFSSGSRDDGLRIARGEYRALLRGGFPGAAWWRHRIETIDRVLGEEEGSRSAAGDGPGASRNMDDTYALFSGGRAVAENLQLDRVLPATPLDDAAALVDVDGVAGITVAPYDWSGALGDAAPVLDPLAALVPADQHAVFFPTFDAMLEVADHADAQGTDVLLALGQITGEASDEAGTRARTQRQLGLPLSELSRLLGPAVIASVAITGGDPYLRAGSDVAILFEARDPAALLALVRARVQAAVAGAEGLQTRSVLIGDVATVEHRTPGREVCTYVGRLGGAVVVTNSEGQMLRLAAAATGRTPSLAALPEYAFFRARYPLGAADESALVVLSDDTIRRWCGPRWRIGASRRTRAEAALAEVQARLVAARAAGRPDATALADPPAGLGTLGVDGDVVRSSVYGSLAFLTPIGELDLDRVSQDEVDLYARWRDGYQRNWSGVFDPIALSLHAGPDRIAADLTVRPLIAGSEYRELIELAGGSSIAPHAGDPHDGALVHWALAIDRHSDLLSGSDSVMRMLMPQFESLGWLGSSVALYADADPFWEELAAASDAGDHLGEHWADLPVALHVEVGDPLALTAFLVALRGLADASAPDMTRWSNERYRDEPYVTVRPTERALDEAGNEFERATIYYMASGEGLVVTMNRGVLERAIDRRLARRAAREAARAEGVEPPPPAGPAWLGDQLAVAVDGSFVRMFERIAAGAGFDAALRQASFANLPVLNEWRRLFPDQDPVAVHERMWHRRLACPGGGAYVWNAGADTMESTVYGHPAAPRDGPVLPEVFGRLLRAAAGLTFEQDGLRARAELHLTPR